MTRVTFTENGQRVTREARADDGVDLFPADDIADANLREFVDDNARMKALAFVVADLAFAAGLAPDVATARHEVRDRFKTYYKTLMT